MIGIVQSLNCFFTSLLQFLTLLLCHLKRDFRLCIFITEVRIGLFLYYISHLNCFVNMPFESTAYHIPSFSTKAITVGLIRISWAYLIIASPCP